MWQNFDEICANVDDQTQHLVFFPETADFHEWVEALLIGMRQFALN